jgi:hypothetical protein
MEVFVFYILSIWGLTHILVSSKIFENFRNWTIIRLPFIGDMLSCYQCTSFWVSLALYPMFNDLKFGGVCLEFYGLSFPLDAILCSFIGSGLISFISVIMSFLIKKSR